MSRPFGILLSMLSYPGLGMTLFLFFRKDPVQFKLGGTVFLFLGLYFFFVLGLLKRRNWYEQDMTPTYFKELCSDPLQMQKLFRLLGIAYASLAAPLLLSKQLMFAN